MSRLQDIVRCFACNVGLKNRGPDDPPWIKHAQSFPQCQYVRHVKSEEFTNLVQMMTDQSDEEVSHHVLGCEY
ncbi:hypothetical protein CHS0354_025969 [Potamilus streckersoni]|uniref:Uncharacterized protein n=1 Tax=Potamilus streckersoni TaxID=2493646 RepID=A0AAE0T4K6_9BIVA|nr:hypothetical protein CHS0354_025969 [Potamilus streckersoni]